MKKALHCFGFSNFWSHVVNLTSHQAPLIYYYHKKSANSLGGIEMGWMSTILDVAHVDDFNFEFKCWKKTALQSKVERKQVKWNGDMITVLYVLVSADLLHCETTS